MNELSASKWLAKHPKAGEDYGLKAPKAWACTLVCVCVRAHERERERDEGWVNLGVASWHRDARAGRGPRGRALLAPC
jgi:hypothetical protein